MAASLQLQLQGSTNFTFDLEGDFTPSIEPVYKESANPPQVAQLRHTWTFERCRIVPSDGAQSTLWTDVLAFLAYFESRTAHPTYARLVRDPGGTPVTVWTLGPSTYEQLRFEAIDGEPDPDEAAVSWLRTATFTVRVSAVRKFPRATTGLVNFAQEVEASHDVSGRRRLRWNCRFETAEGTSALEKAQLYAAIDISGLPTYSYLTNGPYGFDYRILDADEVEAIYDSGGSPTLPARVPTIVETVCEVQEWGIVIGAAVGNAVGEVEVRTTTEITATETITTRTASAKGPNAEQFVRGQKLGGTLRVNRIEVSDTHIEASGIWERSTARSQVAQQASASIEVTISGGGEVSTFRMIPGGYPPVRQVGALIPYRASVEVLVRRTGGEGKASELPFPDALGDPWVLDRETLEEGEPVIDGDPAADPQQTRWVRRLKAEYWSATKPAKRPLEELRKLSLVPTYVLR